MRRLKFTNFNIILFISLIIVMLTFTTTGIAGIGSPCGTPKVVELLAGQTINAGTVTVANDATQLCVTYDTTGTGWLLTETHLHIAKSLAEIPQTKTGNPIPGKFAYSRSYNPPVSKDEYCFNLTALLGVWNPGDTIYIAAHAVVVKLDGSGNIIQKETGWAGDLKFPGKNWATYFTYMIQYCTPPPSPPPAPDLQCETAFAYLEGKATCFLDIDLPGFKPERWGWTNGPLGTGSYTFDIYAGAGQCDRSKGEKVGVLSVSYNGSVTVTYTMTGDYKLYETHLYVGNDMLPKDKKGKWTVAPGQYPYIHEDPNGASTVTFGPITISGYIYIIAHAKVCWPSASGAPAMQTQTKPEGVASLWGKIKSEH